MLVVACIYCRSTSAPPFPKEHVVPQAFGRFQNNLTIECVCGACNQFFSEELELLLTRDSIEALMRVRYGLKTKRGSRKLARRLVVKVISPGHWKGSRIAVYRTADGTSLIAEPLPQVGFRNSGEKEYLWILEEDLGRTELWDRYRVESGTETIIAGNSGTVSERIANSLVRLGLNIKKLEPIPSPGREVEAFAEPMLDDIIFRGVSKIALNFLAHSQSARFVLMPDFDPIRDYIRQGIKPKQPPVSVTPGPMVCGDRGFCGHDVVLRRNNNGIDCLVSLFNHHVYRVQLCADYSGSVWHPLDEWRRFDVQTQMISQLAREVTPLVNQLGEIHRP